MAETVVASDLFCGGGGTSQGLAQACQELGRPVELTAINCWPRAIETHEANHPWARHICQRIEHVRPQDLFENGHLNLLVASPECIWWSVARGGKPVNDQLRSSPYLVPQWLESIEVDSFLIENVPEFQNWGPLHTWGPKKGKPDKNRKGQKYKAYLQMLRAEGYSVEARVLNAADYGAYTTRRRLFILGLRGENRQIRWPEPTHCVLDKKTRRPSVKGLEPWNKARDILDFKLPNRSIFDPVKPLAWNTMKRIAVGCRKFWGLDLKPYLAALYPEKVAELPDFVPTHSSTGTGLDPFVVPPLGYYSRGGDANPARSVDEPLPTLTSRAAENRVIEPMMMTLDRPLTNRSLPRGVDEPVAVVTGNSRTALLQAFLVPNKGEAPGQEPRTHSLDKPLPTITATGNSGTVVQPILVEYYGNGKCRPVEDPVPTVTGKDRFALVIPYSDGHYLDIRIRMLVPPELAQAMGFPRDYEFTGTKTEVVKQIGNAVEVTKARALCRALLEQGGAGA
jgi:DNA (cytosine-5)-methyltransferase 1